MMPQVRGLRKALIAAGSQHFFAVVGASGIGKTQLAFALDNRDGMSCRLSVSGLRL